MFQQNPFAYATNQAAAVFLPHHEYTITLDSGTTFTLNTPTPTTLNATTREEAKAEAEQLILDNHYGVRVSTWRDVEEDSYALFVTGVSILQN